MQIRYLGHSCIEIIGEHHVLIDPDFTRSPMAGVDYILVSHAHRDHLGRVGEVLSGTVIASKDVCEVALKLGVCKDRLVPVEAGDMIGNIHILPGFSVVSGYSYKIFHFLFKHKLPDFGGTPLSFLIEDRLSILHIGDAHEFNFHTSPDILCVPWRTPPFGSRKYKEKIVSLVKNISPKYVLPVHYDLPGTEADPKELSDLLHCQLLLGNNWHEF